MTYNKQLVRTRSRVISALIPAVVHGSSPDNCVVADDPAAFAAALVRLAAAAPRDVDGRAFHRSQRAALDRAVERGLRKLGRTPAAVTA